MEFDGVLGGNDHEGAREVVGLLFDGDLGAVHGFEEGGLCLGSGAVDFIGQDYVGEYRPGFEVELTLQLVEDGDAEDVGREHVAGELDAGKGEAERARNKLGEGGFADAWHVLDEQMPPGKHGDERLFDGLAFAFQDELDVVLQLGDFRTDLNRQFSGFSLVYE